MFFVFVFYPSVTFTAFHFVRQDCRALIFWQKYKNKNRSIIIRATVSSNWKVMGGHDQNQSQTKSASLAWLRLGTEAQFLTHPRVRSSHISRGLLSRPSPTDDILYCILYTIYYILYIIYCMWLHTRASGVEYALQVLTVFQYCFNVRFRCNRLRMTRMQETSCNGGKQVIIFTDCSSTGRSASDDDESNSQVTAAWQPRQLIVSREPNRCHELFFS